MTFETLVTSPLPYQIQNACDCDSSSSGLVSSSLYSSLAVPLYLPLSQANSRTNSPRASIVAAFGDDVRPNTA